MIEGLKFDISSQELKDRCKQRAKYYENKVEKCEKIKNDSNQEIDEHSLHMLNETVAGAEERIRLFYFIHDHVAPDETYRLSRPELVSIDFI